jgi:hypothetical protein
MTVSREKLEQLAEQARNLPKEKRKELDAAAEQVRDWFSFDEAFVAVDIEGKSHSLHYWGAYVKTRRAPEAGALWRVFAGYDPELAEMLRAEGDPAETIEFLVTDAEHTRMLKTGVVEEVDEVDVGVSLVERVAQILNGTGSQ